MKARKIAQKNGKNGKNIGQIEQNFTLILELMSMCAFDGVL